MRSASVAPAVSARTHIAVVYVPAAVPPTQLGESLRSVVLAVVPVLANFADQLPEWPPLARVSEMFAPPPEVFQPTRLVSNPELPTRLRSTVTRLVALEVLPAVSATVTVTV